jgi:hypothetical protein
MLRIAGKVAVSGGFLGCLTGLMLHFHITTYPYLAWALAGSLAIYFGSRPSLRSLTGTVALGAAFAIVYGVVKGGPLLGAGLAFLGLGSLASMGLEAIWSGPEQRRVSLDTCLTASMFPLFLIVSGFSLAVTSIVHPKTYDLFLYAFDEKLGLQQSFVVGRILARFGSLRQVCYFGYESLPLAMAIAFTLERRRSGRQKSSIVLAFTVAAAGGFLLYNFCPAVGPVHVFGTQFPYAPPVAGLDPFQLVAVALAPRNAMPSVHITMALLILWNSRWGARLWSILAAALLGITVLATLGFGEHYLADLCVAVPFALLAQGVAANGLPWRSSARIAAVGAGGIAVLGWLTYLRLPSPPLAGYGILPWVLLLGTAVASIVLESRLHAAVARADVPALRWVNEGEFPEQAPVAG